MRLTFALAFALLFSASPVSVEAQSNGLRQKVEFLESALESAMGRIAELETQFEHLQENSVLDLDGVLSVDPSTLTARFSGVNVQIVNGVGQTDSVNGLGNLIVGYDEDPLTGSDKTGSHNLVVGREHSYSSYGGAVLAYRNSISGPYSNVTGGRDNVATGRMASVTGGYQNEARTIKQVDGAPTVSGGFRNIADVSGGTAAPSVSGGTGNTASGGSTGGAASISGGLGNTANSCGSVSGGQGNSAGRTDGGCPSILGGWGNVVRTLGTGAIVGGFQNTIVGGGSVPSGGAPVVVGGRNNTAGSFTPVILGGQDLSLSGEGPGGIASPTIPPIP
jgi:hypothetical protein